MKLWSWENPISQLDLVRKDNGEAVKWHYKNSIDRKEVDKSKELLPVLQNTALVSRNASCESSKFSSLKWILNTQFLSIDMQGNYHWTLSDTERKECILFGSTPLRGEKILGKHSNQLMEKMLSH